MTTTCSTCNLPDELCVCQDIAKDTTTLQISMEKRSFDKPVTIIEGAVDEPNIDEDELSSELKASFGCGGTVKNGNIELQGDHREAVRDALLDRGFDVSNRKI